MVVDHAGRGAERDARMTSTAQVVVRRVYNNGEEIVTRMTVFLPLTLTGGDIRRWMPPGGRLDITHQGNQGSPEPPSLKTAGEYA